MRAILQALGDLPREAETEALTLDELRAENADLKRRLAAARKSQQGVSEAEVKARAAADAANATPQRQLREIVRLAEQGLIAKQERPRPALAQPVKPSVPASQPLRRHRVILPSRSSAFLTLWPDWRPWG